MNAPLNHKTPDRLERNMVILPIPGGPAEVVRYARLVNGRWMVRTTVNLHRMPTDLLVPVLAEFVDGVGFVTAEAVA